MENTLANKELFLAKHWGQKVLVRSTTAEQYNERRTCHYINWNGWLETSFLTLKPISSISDEDAIEVCKILFSHPDPDYNIDWDELERSLGNIERSNRGLNIEVSVRCFEGVVKIGWDLLFELLNDEGQHCDLTDLQKTWVVDYLRSKGYALPCNGRSVENLQEYGWIKFVEPKNP